MKKTKVSDEEGWGKEETCPSLCMIKLSKGGGGLALKMNVIVVALVVHFDLCLGFMPT